MATGSKEQHWSDGQVRLFVKDVRKRVGDGWNWLVPDIRRALIAEKALSILCGQDRACIPTDALTELLTRMLAEAGLEIA